MNPQDRNQSLAGKTFPQLEGNSLSRQKVVFPEDVKGNLAVIVLVFEQQAQRIVNPWTEFMISNYPDIGYFEVPMISGWYGPFSGWIDGGMRSGVPNALHDKTVTYYGDRSPYFQQLLMTDKSSCYVFLLDEEGLIHYTTEGVLNPAKSQELAREIELLHS